MTQPAAGQSRPRQGNPVNAHAGAVKRAVIFTLTKEPTPMTTLAQCVGVSRARVFAHLARMKAARTIAGYTTAGGIVRVWR